MNYVGHLRERRTTWRHERRTTDAEQPVERILAIQGLPGCHESIGEQWTPQASTVARDGKDPVDVDGMVQRPQPLGHALQSIDATATLGLEEQAERRIVRIDEIPEHVHVTVIFDGRDLDTVDQPDGQRLRRLARVEQRGDGIVIRDADHAQADLRSQARRAPQGSVCRRKLSCGDGDQSRSVRRLRGADACARCPACVADARPGHGTRE